MKKEYTVHVWDIIVRIFHWSLVVTFIIAYFTAEEENIVHIYSGYTVLALIVLRVIWGFVGTKYARFSNFIYSPFTVIQYLKSVIKGNPKHYLGHNPAGGYMVVALLLGLFVVTVSGLKVYAIEEGLGPLAKENNKLTMINNAYADKDEYEHEYEKDNDEHEDEAEEFWEEIHEFSTNVTLILIFLHIAGVLISSHVHKQNLIMPMITGRKKPI